MNKKLLIGLTALALCACKPTEKNYQSAYDKAFEAAQRKVETETESIDGRVMESLNGPRIQIIDGDTLYISTDRMRPFETTVDKDKGKVGVAVAHYKMPTNARKHMQALAEEYPDAIVVNDGQENYYVVIAIVPQVSEAIPIIRNFKSYHPDFRYIGLPQGPLTIYIY